MEHKLLFSGINSKFLNENVNQNGNPGLAVYREEIAYTCIALEYIQNLTFFETAGAAIVFVL